ncbi:PQQ-binding-like beta-propeller repeat protein [candidate division KSB1 bacterium]|nr:PQQ-binding-like beta-propeller repeat protein [candidate division KSB1 bacterium]
MPSHSYLKLALAIGCCLILINLLNASTNWSRFRGPNGQGISSEENLPTSWSSNDYDWIAQLPGSGHSSPVVWQNRVFITSADKTKAKGYLLSIDLHSGTILWTQTIPVEAPKMHPDNSLAASTPVVDETQVYVVWTSKNDIRVIAYTHDGRQQWAATYPPVHSRHGASNSPMLVDNILIITREQETDSPYASSWIGIDKNDGSTVWEIERPTAPDNSFSTPCVMTSETGEQLVVFTSESNGLTAVRPVDGTIIWEVNDIFTSRVVVSPVIDNGYLLSTSRNEGFVFHINSLKTSPDIKYKLEKKFTPYVPTPLMKDNLLYIVMDNGSISCHQLTSGELLWRERPSGAIYGSPVWVDGHIYMITRKGEVIVVQAGETYQLASIIPLDEKSHATPAVADGRLLLRTESKLFCVGSK